MSEEEQVEESQWFKDISAAFKSLEEKEAQLGEWLSGRKKVIQAIVDMDEES